MLRPVAILTVLLGLTASAQPLSAARERQGRRVALSSGPSDPVPELRVAAGVLTTLVFDAPLDRSSVELEGRERFRLVDAGDRSLVLEPAVDLGPGERLGLRVLFAGSSSPIQGQFILITRRAEVDTRIEVFRRKDSVELLQAELAEMRAQVKAQADELQALRAVRSSGGPAELIMSGMLDHSGVQVSLIKTERAQAHGVPLIVESATSFRAPTWAAISVKVRNHGKNSWAPASARLVNPRRGTSLGVLNVRSALPQIGPEDAGLVVIETEVPSWPPGEVCSLELLDSDGVRQVLVPGVAF